MNKEIIKKHNFQNTQNGFVLVVILFIVGLLGSVLTGVSLVKSGENRSNEARIAGWEGAQVARAARIYVRDLNAITPDLKINLSTNPTEIPISELITMNLLPSNFGRIVDGQYYNALNQPIRVWMANYPVDGNPNAETTHAVAYVVFEDSGKTDSDTMLDVANSLLTNNVSVQAPIFDETTNLSGECGTNDAVAIWNSGCMNAIQYTFLTQESFVPGSLVIPAWQSVNFDTRAVLRYPSLDFGSPQTMLTDLKMAPQKDCDANPANFVSIPSDTQPSVQTNFCGSIDDDVATLTDNRRSILNINNLSAAQFISDSESGNTGVFTDYANGLSSERNNSGIQIGGTLNATGSVKTYGAPVNVAGNLEVDRNITISSSAGGVAPSANIRTVDTGNAFATTLEVNNAAILESNFSVSNIASGISGVVATGEIVADDLTAIGSNPVINVSNNLNISRSIDAQITEITGSNMIDGYSFISAEIGAPELQVINNANVGNTTYLQSNTNTAVVNITNSDLTAECFGECPLRNADSMCRNLAASGVQLYDECMAGFR